MRYSEDIIILKSNVQSAMKDQISWDSVVSLMESICISFQKAKELNYVLLDELKTCSSLFAIEDQNDQALPDPGLKFEIKQEVLDENQDPLDTKEDKQVDATDFVNVEIESEPKEEEMENNPDEKDDLEKQNDHDVENNVNVQTFACDLCDKTFTKDNSLYQHKKRKHGWQLENFVGSKVKALCRYESTVKEPSPTMYQCEQCDKTFKYTVSLKEHVKIEHEGIKDSYSCEECGKTFSRYMSLRLHIKGIHKKERNFKCDKCPSKFLMKQSLERHLRTVHEGAKDFVCPECGKAVTSSGGLEKHILTVHRKERKHECEICKVKLASANSLRDHIRTIHEKIKSNCEKCGKSFSQESTLKKHIKIVHEGVVPYPCELCEKGFNTKIFLKDHVLMVHKGINPYVCDFCDKVFTQAHMMKTHMKNNTCRKA